MTCREFTLLQTTSTAVYALPLCCRAWTCEHCRVERKARLIWQACSGAPNTFITITSRRKPGADPIIAAHALALAWRKCVRAACKRYGYKHIPYFVVMEATKQGWPHLHVLCRVKWIDQRWLSCFMLRELSSPIVDIRRCKSVRHAAWYVAKYVGKDPHKFGTCKRYWQTKDYREARDDEPPPCEYADGRWEIVEKDINQVVLHWTLQAWQVEKVGHVWKGIPRGPP